VVTYCDIRGGWEGILGANNINAAPALVDPKNGNYALKGSSPCIDTGRDTSAPSYGTVLLDLTGAQRGFDGDGIGRGSTGDGSDYDIGAHEYFLIKR